MLHPPAAGQIESCYYIRPKIGFRLVSWPPEGRTNNKVFVRCWYGVGTVLVRFVAPGLGHFFQQE